MNASASLISTAAIWLCAAAVVNADELPFQHKVEVYRGADGDTMAFTVRLEQPFLAEEFEQSSYLRLRGTSDNAYLIYPQETMFRQKHAEFYGRLKAGEAEVSLTLSYETVSENLDGSRRVDTRTGTIKVPVPAKETGPKSIFLQWAKQQNQHFAELLKYYPDESFYHYVLLQSAKRYGIDRPRSLPTQDISQLDVDLFRSFSGSQAIQTSLQFRTLSGGGSVNDLNQHISSISPPSIRHHDYEALLKQSAEAGAKPTPHAIAKLIPDDQYMIVFNSVSALADALDLSFLWGEGVARLFSIRAQDHQLRDKLQEQLILQRKDIETMESEDAVGAFAITGGDLFMLEGTDVSLVIELKKPAAYDKYFASWLADAKKKYPELATRSFNYRGHKIVAHYTANRIISSFSVRHQKHQIVSNSHRAIRRILDAALGEAENLDAQLDYQYLTTLLPPSDDAKDGYFFASKNFLLRQVAPAEKISEKRRLQCFNNLVMLNNASLFYRLEYGRSPKNLSDLIDGRFIDMTNTVCPHGGAYAFDSDHDSCTCSMHNRLRYLTPNQELNVLKVSRQEKQQYAQYKTRYNASWQQVFNPIAVRISTSPRVKIETCVLPQLNGSGVSGFKSMFQQQSRPINVAKIAPSAVASSIMTVGKERAADFLQLIPGVDAALQTDPTLTDLEWLGEQVGFHFCDGETALQIDPAFLGAQVPVLGQMTTSQQLLASGLVMATGMPVYATIDVDNPEKAKRLLELLSKEIFLQGGSAGMVPTQLDGYRLPDYKGQAIYVFSIQLHAAKIRLHVSLVDGQLVAATKPNTLHEVIDASKKDAPDASVPGHMMVRFNRRALDAMYDEVQMYWAEKSRLACHRNTILIYNLHKLYGIAPKEVPDLAKVKYGIRPYCPDHGMYSMDKNSDRCTCSVHGNREFSRQKPRIDRKSSFSQFIENLDEVKVVMQFYKSAMFVTAEVVRSNED